ncbi:MAG TPA: hypothetical protein VNZ27_06370 [Rhodanobacter sp.]|jgi:hypothetical protein|nr:hypothetical protein [Rhodanobacter sp.]
MTALKLIVSAAGREALANAKHDGTNAIKIASVGITATSFNATPTTSMIPGEIKRISTISGGAVAPDTLHVTIRDDSTDSYSVRGVGLYLDDGITLFGSYSQATDLLQKSSQATMLLAGDIQFADIDATSLTFGDTNFQMNQATTEISGVLELATDAETITGIDSQRAITPKGLLAALNDRLGAGAPSVFVKSLLTKVSALAFVTALGIRGAASYDTGSGNGLDADLLDGQHGAYYHSYANLTGVPGTFTPSAHQHAAADITSGTLAIDRGGTGAGSFTAGSYLVGNGTGALAEKTPAQVLANIGAAAVAHSHPISDINGLQPALDARPLQTSVTAQITAAVNALVNGSPGALDTLKELADAMGDDPNFAATVTNALALKAPSANPTFTGTATFPSNNGVMTLKSGTGDNATYALHNVRMQLHWGLGIADYAGNVQGVYDARAGIWDTKGGYKVNGQAVWHAGSFNPAAYARLDGALMTGDLSCRSNADGKTIANYTAQPLKVQSDAATAAAMLFIRNGNYAGYFGIDTDNQWKVGGYSMGAGSWRVVHEGMAAVNLPGSLTTAGAIAASNVAGGTPNGSRATLNTGGGNGGYIAFFMPDGTRAGYIGNPDAGTLMIAPEGGRSVAIFGPSVSLAALAASGAITGASVRATGTIMAAGGFQIG